MTKHAQAYLSFTIFAGIAFGATHAHGKRSPPEDIPPVVNEGVRYEAPHFDNPCGQNGGCIVAFDDASGTLLWSVNAYCTRYDPQLETDAQDVFITSLSVNDGQLNVTNEKGLHFAIDLRTQAISGDARGCPDSTGSGCSLSPTSRSPRLLLLAGAAAVCLWVAMRRRARRGPTGPQQGRTYV